MTAINAIIGLIIDERSVTIMIFLYSNSNPGYYFSEWICVGDQGNGFTVNASDTLTWKWSDELVSCYPHWVPYTVTYNPGSCGGDSYVVTPGAATHTVLGISSTTVTVPSGKWFVRWRDSDTNQLVPPGASAGMTRNIILDGVCSYYTVTYA